MPGKSFQKLIFLVFILPSIWLIQGCSKGAGPSNGNSTSGYYLTANINGQSWSSNLKTTVQNSPAVGILATAYGTQIMVGIGLKVGNSDSSGIFFIFPASIALNQSTRFDSAHFVDAGYVTEAAPKSSTYYAYTSSASYGGSGSLTVTVFDQTSDIIEGTFSGTFASKIGAAPITISNGKFRCPYTTNVAAAPTSGNITFKF